MPNKKHIVISDEKDKIVINIHGGNNQIFPNATHAEQHLHFHTGESKVTDSVSDTGSEQHNDIPDLASRLPIYINRVEERQRFIVSLRSCQSASEVARVVVHLVQNTPGLTFDLVKTGSFISILLCCASGVKRGLTVPNFRRAIVEAWACRKE